MNIASLDLDEGYCYLLLGQTQANVGDSTSLLMAEITGTVDGMSARGRSPMTSGGGAICFGTSIGGTTVYLRGYGYSDKSYNYTGHLLAIPYRKYS